MQLNSDFFQNNFKLLNTIFNKIHFYSRVVEMKNTYVYEHDGIFVGKMYELPSIDAKIEIISSILNENNLKFKLFKKDKIFEVYHKSFDYSLVLNIGFDDTSVGGALGIYLKDKVTFKNLLWGSMFDFILNNFYDYELKNYRFCALDLGEVESITKNILLIYFDFENEFNIVKSRILT